MKQYTITVNGTAYAVTVEENSNAVAAPAPVAAPVKPAAPMPTAVKPTAPAPAPAKPAVPAPTVSSAAPAKDATIVGSPMQGTILDVKAAPGQAVNEGDVIMILEAMKMENEIVAPCSGTIDTIQVAKGASVAAGDTLASIK